MLVNENNIEEIFDEYEYKKNLKIKEAKGFVYTGDKFIDGIIFLKSLIKEGKDNNIKIDTEHDLINYLVPLESLYSGFCKSDVETLCYFNILYSYIDDCFYTLT